MSAFVEPIADIARGVLFETSSSSKAFYVWVFVRPLYVPQSELDLTCGIRLRSSGSAMWDEGWADLADRLGTALTSERASLVLRVSSALELVSAIESRRIPVPPVQTAEISGYSHARVGKYELAIEELQNFERGLRPSIDWQVQRRERSEQLRDAIANQSERVPAIMDAWVATSRRTLGLE